MSQNGCYHSVNNILSCSFPSQKYKNEETKKYKFAYCFLGVKFLSVKLMEELRVSVFENGVLRGIIGPKGKDTAEQWRKEHVEELIDLYRSANIYRSIQSRKIICSGHVARMGSGEFYTEFWWVIIRERVHLEDPNINMRIILKWIYSKWNGNMDRIVLPHSTDRRLKLVNAVMNRYVP